MTHATDSIKTARAELLDLARIVPSKTNPRTNFSKDGIAELAESIRRHGVLQPILVRPIAAGPISRLLDRSKNGRYEIVAGERRFRAAKKAGLAYMPAVVRVMSDQEACELQVVENLQREDLHPLEVAEKRRRTYKTLLGKDAPIVLARDRKGDIHRLVERREASKILQKKFEWARPSEKLNRDDRYRRQLARERREREIKKKVMELATARILDAAGDPSSGAFEARDFWRYLICQLIHSGHYQQLEAVCRRRGIPVPGEGEAVALLEATATLDVADLRLLTLELALHLDDSWSSGLSEGFKEACSLCAVDLNALRKQAATELKKTSGKKEKK